jgi:repressor LexA
MGNSNDELSDRQTDIMLFIERYIREHRCPPTNREIGSKFEIKSTGHVDYHLTALEEKGFIQREKKKSRSIRVLRPLNQPGLLIHGTIAAGLPLDIYAEDQQDTLDLSGHAPENSSEYVLQVRGHSMIEDHISDGDYVIVLPTTDVYDGDIVVATHRTSDGGERGAATLKRFHREKGRIRLQPANSDMDPIYVPAAQWDEEWEIQGKVTAVYRRFGR